MNTTSTTFTSKAGFTYEVFDLVGDSIDGYQTIMEVCDPSGFHFATVGVWTDGKKRLEDYDGVYSLHKNHIRALRLARITVPRSFE